MTRTFGTHQCILSVVLVALTTFAPSLRAQRPGAAPSLRKVTVGDGVVLHYEERGQGTPVIFVHGSLSDGSYWHDQLAPFAKAGFRAIAYSRRYNFPNTNEARPGYSAVIDADDLAALIQKLRLGKVDVVGHSYGALTALFLAVRHSELVRRLVLCEAPAVPLLAYLPGDQSAVGKATLADIQKRMVRPMQAAFGKGDEEEGVRVFIGYVMRDPQAWDHMSTAAHEETLKNVREWDVMMTTGELFPNLDPKAARNVRAPALLLSGEKSYPFLGLIDEELTRLLPDNRRIILLGATHQMWFEQPDECRKDVLEFLRQSDAHAEPKASTRPLGTVVSKAITEIAGAAPWSIGRLTVAEGKLTLDLRGADKFWAFKSSLEIPLVHIACVQTNPEAARGWHHGIRMPGTNVPGLITAGTFYQYGKRVFWDVHPEKIIVIDPHGEQ